MKFLFLLFLFVPYLVFAQTQEHKKDEPDFYKDDDRNFLPTGQVTREQILSFKVFNYNYVEYVPAADPVQNIHNFPNPLEIKVFFGDWCTDSKKQVPALIKTMEFADNKKIKVTYINVSRDKTEPADQITEWGIEKVPTLIVLNNGKKAGRIVETPKTTLDGDLSEILSQLTQVP